MTPENFQALALGFLAALLVVIPAAGAVAIVGIQTWQKIAAVAEKQGATAATVAQHDHQLNGALNERIDQRAKAVVGQHVAPSAIVPSPTATAPVMPEPLTGVAPEDLAVLARLAEAISNARSGAFNVTGSTGSGRGSGLSRDASTGGGGASGS